MEKEEINTKKAIGQVAIGILIALLFFIPTREQRTPLTMIIAGVLALIIGILFGTLTFEFTNEDQIRIMVGVISIIFVLVSFIQKNNYLLKPTKVKGYFWSSIAGYTSFLIHAGNPPINFYMLPLKLDKISFIGTMTLAFMVINLVKLVPYYFVGLLAPSNLMISLYLLPLAFISVLIGYFVQKRIPEKLFFNIVYVLLFLSGCKLIYDGVI